MASAADAPMRAGMSGSISGFKRQHRYDDLYFVVEALWKQRSDRPVDQPRGQCLLLGRTAFALEEAAGNATGGIGLLDVIDGKRKEILARPQIARGNDGRQHDRVVHVHHDGAMRLACYFAGFQRHGMGTVSKGLFHRIKQWSVLSKVKGWHRGPCRLPCNRPRTEAADPRRGADQKTTPAQPSTLAPVSIGMPATVLKGRSTNRLTCAVRAARSANDNGRRCCP